MNSSRTVQLLGIALSVSIAGTRAQAQHGGDVWIARSGAGQLKIDTTHGHNTLSVVLLPATDPAGAWSNNNPGFDKITQSFPDEDLYPLATGHDVWLEVVSIAPGSYVVVPPSGAILESPGDQGRLSSGGTTLHKHLIWVIDGEDPNYDPQQCLWDMTFVLRDKGTTHYADSEPFTLHFATNAVVRADFDCDGDVDGADFGVFAGCFNGTGNPVPGDCLRTDLNDDSSVDGIDYGLFATCFNGSGNPAGCS